MKRNHKWIQVPETTTVYNKLQVILMSVWNNGLHVLCSTFQPYFVLPAYALLCPTSIFKKPYFVLLSSASRSLTLSYPHAS